MNHPNPKAHFQISMAKSAVRIVAYCMLFGIPSNWAIIAAIMLIFSEIIGIVEEMV